MDEGGTENGRKN